MVKAVGFDSVDALIDATVPTAIRREAMDLGEYTKGFTESGILDKLKCAPCMPPLRISYRCIHTRQLCCSSDVALGSSSAAPMTRSAEMSYGSPPCTGSVHAQYSHSSFTQLICFMHIWLQAAGVQEQGAEVVHRHGLLQHAPAARHPAQPAGEPGLVHAVHALPGGDRPGPVRCWQGTAQP